MSTFTCESVARAALGEPLKQEGQELIFKCPHPERHANGDAHPSFKVNPKKDTWGCFVCGAGGTPWQLAAFLARLDPGDKRAVIAWLREFGLLNATANGNGSHRDAQGEKRRVAIFSYSPDLRKVRLEPSENGKSKMFVWEYREGDKWKSGDGGKQKPLYVNKIFREVDQFDYAVGFEGEAKCDLAGELGIPGFSYKELTTTECKKLKGLKIVLWRDKDSAGEKQVQDAAQKIHDSGHPRSIAFITPPTELLAGGDIVDAVKTFGYNRTQIEELICDAQDGMPQTDGSNTTEPDVITLERGKLPAAVDHAEEILLGQSARLGIFQRAGELVRVISLPEPRKGGGLRRSKGTVQLEPLGGLALTEVFSRIAVWERIDEGKSQIVDCPTKIAAFYISRTGFWRVPVLAGIISAPLMREDGTILSQPGYDEESGLFFISDETWPTIPDQPTRADAETALKILRAPFEEFPFVATEDVTVHIAAILTAIQRRILGACPIFGYSAPAQRSGKSLLAESAAIVATGKPAPATAVSGDREEIRKAITSALREGHVIINLDNVEGPLASPDLAKAITQFEYQDRLLGESRMLRLPTNVLWTATGNNLVFRGDLSSRALLCRIDSGLERPEARTFKIQDLEDFLRNNRKVLVAAALTILRAYHVAGRPRQQVQPWGGFNNWSAFIREPLVWLGLADPCKTRETVLADDPEREESLAALLALQKAFGDSEFTVKTIADRCGSDDVLKSSILSVAAGRQQRHEIDPRRLGWWCRNRKDQVLGGLRLCRSGKASGVAYWRIEVPAGGHRGHGGHFPATGETAEAVNRPIDNGNNTGQGGNDLFDHHDHQSDPSEDEVAL